MLECKSVGFEHRLLSQYWLKTLFDFLMLNVNPYSTKSKFRRNIDNLPQRGRGTAIAVDEESDCVQSAAPKAAI